MTYVFVKLDADERGRKMLYSCLDDLVREGDVVVCPYKGNNSEVVRLVGKVVEVLGEKKPEGCEAIEPRTIFGIVDHLAYDAMMAEKKAAAAMKIRQQIDSPDGVMAKARILAQVFPELGELLAEFDGIR